MTEVVLLREQWNELSKWVAWNPVGDRMIRRIFAALRDSDSVVIEVRLNEDEVELLCNAWGRWVLDDTPRRFVVARPVSGDQP